MKKRWLIYLVLLILSFNLASAVIESQTTQANSLLVINKPEVALVNNDFVISGKYYFTNQQVISAEISFLRNGKLVEKKIYSNEETVDFGYRLREDQVATYPYAIFVKERVGEGEYVETGIDVSMNVISNDIEAVKSEHEMVMAANSDEIYFDDLSIYEPYALRDKMEYSIIQENPTKVDCIISDTLITFEAAESWTGRSTCKAKGSYENISITHTYNIIVMADKALYIKDLDDVFLDEVSNGDVVYENITSFCNYQFEPNQQPYVYLASDPKGFRLEIEDDDLVIHNITRDLTGKHLVKLGCNDQFREFYLNVKEQEFSEYDISLTKQAGKEVLDFGVGTLTLTIPEDAVIGEKNFVEAIISIDNPEMHPFDKVFLLDLDLWVEFEEKTCDEQPCSLSFEMFNHEKGVRNYALVIALENQKALEFEKLEEDYYINSSGTSFIVHKIFDIEFVEKKPDTLANINHNLGIIRPLLTPDSEQALKEMLELSLKTAVDVEKEKERLEKTFDILEASKMIGSSVKVDERGERLDNAVIKIIITPKKKLKNLVVYEYIPKVNAQNIGSIEFDNAILESHSGSFEIIEADPLIAWHFAELENEIELKYELDKETSIPGNTIIFAESGEAHSSLYIAAVIVLIIALAAMIVIFYKRLKTPNREDIKKEIKRETDDMETFFKKEEHDFESILGKEKSHKEEVKQKLKQVEHYIEQRLKAGHKKDDIVMDLLNKGWPSEIVDKILERLER